MSKMSDIFTEIQIQLDSDRDPRAIAQELEVPVAWVYDVIQELLSGAPQSAEMTDAEINAMAEYYDSNKEQGCEFDV
jgi:hypothetical protein